MDAAAAANRQNDVIQSKAFLAWVNAHLKRINQPAISDLVMDLQSGTVLCHLVGAVMHVKVRGFTAAPKHNAHKMANLSLALDTAEAAGLKVTASPQDFADMNTKLVLGFIWSLIAREQGDAGASDPEASSAALRQKLSQLAGGAPVSNLTTAFSDGILLAKMVDKKKSGLINPDGLDASRGVDNVGNALHLLETHFKMPHVLDASDIANNPDPKVMATFLPFVVEALEGPSAFARHDDGPRVFNRAAESSPSSSSSPSSHAAPSYASSSTPSYASYSSSVAASAPAAQNRGGGGGGGVAPSVVRTTPLLNFSVSLASKYPGTTFEAVNVDGRSPEGKYACHQCNGELGSGRCFKFFVPGQGVQYVHSRCCDCSVCQKDFIQGLFYIVDGRLFCTAHYAEKEGIVCKSCNEPIVDFFVTALDAKWHETCFKCHGNCKKAFTEPKFFDNKGYPFCPECHAYAEGRICRKCNKGVVAPIKAMDTFWHDSCFICSVCRKEITGSFVEKDGYPNHADCLKGKSHVPPPPSVPKTSPSKGGSGSGFGGGHGYGAVSSNSSSSSNFSASSAPSSSSSSAPIAHSASGCASCGKNIVQGEAVTVSGKRFHAACFSCFNCKRPIEGSFFSVKEGYCCEACEKNLPPEVEGGAVPCAKCNKILVGSVIQALGKEYHKGL